MVAHAREALPDECCGLLIGSVARIERAHRARNRQASPTRFLIDPKDHFAAIHAARTAGRAVVGVYHSHPASPPVPSPADRADGTDIECLYVIVSLASDPPEVRAYRLRAGRFEEEALALV